MTVKKLRCQNCDGWNGTAQIFPGKLRSPVTLRWECDWCDYPNEVVWP